MNEDYKTVNNEPKNFITYDQFYNLFSIFCRMSYFLHRLHFCPILLLRYVSGYLLYHFSVHLYVYYTLHSVEIATTQQHRHYTKYYGEIPNGSTITGTLNTYRVQKIAIFHKRYYRLDQI